MLDRFSIFTQLLYYVKHDDGCSRWLQQTNEHCMTTFQSADYAKYSHLQGPTFYAKTEVKVICFNAAPNIPRPELLDLIKIISFQIGPPVPLAQSQSQGW